MIFRFLTGPAHKLERHQASVSFETLERALRDGRMGMVADSPATGPLASAKRN
jgi:hypothetical protein